MSLDPRITTGPPVYMGPYAGVDVRLYCAGGITLIDDDEEDALPEGVG